MTHQMSARNLIPSAKPSMIPERVAIDDVIASSFKDFHVRGFDYLCLRRSETETLKVYIFDGDCAKLPTLVAPHDHRYDFTTAVLAGVVDNILFVQEPGGRRYQRFEYRTPLNGGGGFEWAEEVRLSEVARRRYKPGAIYALRAEQIYTIAIRQPQTVLLLRQFEDVVAPSEPTSAFSDDAAPATDAGLYARFTPDEVRKRVALLTKISGLFLEVE